MAYPEGTTNVRGPDLAAERVRRGLRQVDVAERLGLSRSRVKNVEGAWRPARTVVERYLAALTEAEGEANR